jgi:hypothetical protein
MIILLNSLAQVQLIDTSNIKLIVMAMLIVTA